jgi:hypothetical protein
MARGSHPFRPVRLLSAPMKYVDSNTPVRSVSASPPPPAPIWRARGAWAAGLALFAFETTLSALLLPLLPRWMPLPDVLLWISLTAAWGLVNAAAAGYAQPLVRSVAGRRAHHQVPQNWALLRDRADLQGVALLLAMLCPFALFVVWQVAKLSPAALAAILLFFMAMVVKLVALNRFVWLNGMGQIGRDKRILLCGSAVTLALTLLLAPATGAAWGLGLASLFGALVTAVLATRACARLGHNADGAEAAWPARAEQSGLVLLHLCGYLNMATDVVLANHFLSSPQAVSYAFWSRALLSVSLLVGMYTQIRFPAWAQSNPAPLRVELRIGLLLIALLPVFSWLAYGAVGVSALSASLGQLPGWVLGSLALTSALSCAVVLVGQLSNARGAYAFLLPSAVVAACAPLLAWALASLWTPTAFVLGYLVANAVLLFINARHASVVLPDSTAR